MELGICVICIIEEATTTVANQYNTDIPVCAGCKALAELEDEN